MINVWNDWNTQSPLFLLGILILSQSFSSQVCFWQYQCIFRGLQSALSFFSSTPSSYHRLHCRQCWEAMTYWMKYIHRTNFEKDYKPCCQLQRFPNSGQSYFWKYTILSFYFPNLFFFLLQMIILIGSPDDKISLPIISCLRLWSIATQWLSPVTAIHPADHYLQGGVQCDQALLVLT